MRELAIQLRTTRQTLSAWLDRWPDFPIAQRGTNGKEYQFDVADVFAFLRARREEQAASTAERDKALAQLSFPFEGDADDVAATAGLSIKDQIEAVKLRRLHREEAEASGRLVEAVLVSDMLVTCLTQLNRSMHNAVRQAARSHNLPDAVMRSLDAGLAEAQRAFVRDAASLLRSARDPDAQ